MQFRSYNLAIDGRMLRQLRLIVHTEQTAGVTKRNCHFFARKLHTRLIRAKDVEDARVKMHSRLCAPEGAKSVRDSNDVFGGLRQRRESHGIWLCDLFRHVIESGAPINSPGYSKTMLICIPVSYFDETVTPSGLCTTSKTSGQRWLLQPNGRFVAVSTSQGCAYRSNMHQLALASGTDFKGGVSSSG